MFKFQTKRNAKTGLTYKQPLFHWNKLKSFPQSTYQTLEKNQTLHEGLQEETKRIFLLSLVIHASKGQLHLATSRNRTSFNKTGINANKAIETLNWAEEKNIIEIIAKGTPSSGEATIIRITDPNILREGKRLNLKTDWMLLPTNSPVSNSSKDKTGRSRKGGSSSLLISVKASRKCQPVLRKMVEEKKATSWLSSLAQGPVPANISYNNGLVRRKRILEEMNRRNGSSRWELERALLEVQHWQMVDDSAFKVVTPPHDSYVQLDSSGVCSRVIYTSVFRGGNVHTYKSGGRVYNLFQTLSSGLRRSLLLDGERVVEIDKVASQPSILFALCGRVLPEGFYSLVGGGDEGFGKAFTLVAIGASWSSDLELIRCWNASSARLSGGYSSLTFRELRRIKRVFGEVWSLLGDQVWAYVQWLESEWLFAVLEEFFSLSGGSLLTVHDSIVVGESQRALLFSIMRRVWRRMFGVEGTFRIKGSAVRSSASNPAPGRIVRPFKAVEAVASGEGSGRRLKAFEGGSVPFEGALDNLCRVFVKPLLFKEKEEDVLEAGEAGGEENKSLFHGYH